MKKIAHLLMGRLTIVGVSILLQICWLFLVLWKFSYQFTYANLIIRAAAIVLVLVIANKWENPANKLSWTFLILLSPILGIMLYFLFGRSGLTKHTREQMDAVNRKVDACMPVDEEAVRLLQEADPSVLRQSKYIADWGHFPVYRNTATKYYESGEAMFPDMLAALESAEHFIFLEYFIIEEGHMFHQIEDILEKKVKEGVEVRLIYDDVGCIGTLPPRYYKQLQKKGIKCAAFNPFRPLLSVIMNNRDHRKIFVVDGAVGFTGGINLADEYINEVKRFGYWKDTGVRIEGEAVWSLTSMFLSMWNYIVHSTEDYSRFMPAQHQKYVDRTAYKCYRCHGASVQGNPTAKNAVAMPNGHYVNNDPSTFELDPIRNECRSCHSVDPNKKLGDDATYEEAEVETGQEGLDD